MRVSHSVMDRDGATDGGVAEAVCAQDDCHKPRANSPTAGKRLQPDGDRERNEANAISRPQR